MTKMIEAPCDWCDRETQVTCPECKGTGFVLKEETCCEWHDHLPEMFAMETTPEDCFDECGLAGMGTPSVCCRNCPQADWFIKSRGMKPEHIFFVKEIMALPIGERP